MKVVSFSRGAKCAAALVLLCGCLSLGAQAPEPMVPHPGLPGLRTITPAAYREHLEELQILVATCQQADAACDAKRVGELDDAVQMDGGAPVVVRYAWLRDLLEDRNDPDHTQRRALLPHAAERLERDLAEVPAPGVALTARMRSARSSVLERSEFRTAETYSLQDRISAWFSALIFKLFGGVSSLGRMAPWLGLALEWGTLAVAAGLLFFWVYRALDRQRVALGSLRGDAAVAEREAESRAWAEQARRLAGQGKWRDAIHAFYWASIVLLEDRRTLRRSPTRTPREALQLIDPASHLRGPLQAQTASFERIWYGLRPASPDEYAEALRQHQALQVARQSATA